MPTPTRALLPLAAFVGGLQLAVLNPVVALLLAQLYGAGPAEVGTVLALMNASGFVAAVVIPAWADRRGRYLEAMLLCGALTLLTAVLLTLTTSLALAAIVLVVLAGPAGVWSGMLFAQQRSSGGRAEDLVRTRAVFSIAWVAGPPLGTGLITGFGERSVLVLIAVIAALSLGLTTLMLRARRGAEATTPRPAGAPGGEGQEAGGPVTSRARIVTTVLALTLLQAGNAASVTALPLLVTRTWEQSAAWSGAALGLCSLLEIPIMLGVARLTRRVRPTVLMTIGGACAVLYYAGVGLVSSPVLLLVLQLPNALAIAAVSGVGMAWMQETISPPGRASGISLNSRRVGAILSGPVLATASLGAVGYALPYLVMAALALAATVVIALTARHEGVGAGAPAAGDRLP